MRTHKKWKEDFDRELERAKKINQFLAVVAGILGLGLVGFFVWVVVVLLRFVGAI